jgi:hypothetical protein
MFGHYQHVQKKAETYVNKKVAKEKHVPGFSFSEEKEEKTPMPTFAEFMEQAKKGSIKKPTEPSDWQRVPQVLESWWGDYFFSLPPEKQTAELERIKTEKDALDKKKKQRIAWAEYQEQMKQEAELQAQAKKKKLEASALKSATRKRSSQTSKQVKKPKSLDQPPPSTGRGRKTRHSIKSKRMRNTQRSDKSRKTKTSRK